MDRRRGGVHVLVALAALVGACNSSPGAVVKLDGSPRVPDREGVIVTADTASVTIEDRKFELDKDRLVAFSTYNRTKLSLSTMIGDYVHAGLRNGKVVWLARIGRVVQTNPQRPVVIYQGEVRKVAGSRLEFKDGTVLTLEKGLRMPPHLDPGLSNVVINVKTHRVQGVTLPSPRPTTTTTSAS